MKKMYFLKDRGYLSVLISFACLAFWLLGLVPFQLFWPISPANDHRGRLGRQAVIASFYTVGMALGLGSSALAAEGGVTPAAQKQTDPELKAIKEVVLKTYEGWMSRNPENSAPYFRKAPGDLFFDIWPVFSPGWDAYKGSSQRFLATLAELKIAVKDMRVERHGNVAWVLAVVDADSTSKKGEKFHVANRYTGILVKLDGAWKVAHEHWSVPTRAGGFENW